MKERFLHIRRRGWGGDQERKGEGRMILRCGSPKEHPQALRAGRSTYVQNHWEIE